jgi:hypothetical protein
MSAYPFKLDDSYPISLGFARCRAAAAPLNTTMKSLVVSLDHLVGSKLAMVTFPL